MVSRSVVPLLGWHQSKKGDNDNYSFDDDYDAGDDDVGLVMMMTMTLMMMAMTVLVTVPKVSCKWETGQEAPTSKCHHLRSRFVKSAMGVSNGVWGYLLKIKWKSSSRFDLRKK